MTPQSFPIAADDPHLRGLQGAVFSTADAAYRIEKPIGVGSMAAAFLATRRGPNGENLVVVKVTLPSFLRQAGPAAGLALRKEAVALGRLNAVVPPNPFVVRYIDVGEVIIEGSGGRTELPWIALEYVHGGDEGSTLLERVESTVEHTGHAFDPRRAERAIHCLTSGLAAIHALQIVHRDLKPENILCCGSGEGEILKIADFGIARPVGMKETFGFATLGTIGYAPPEQNGTDPTKVGPWSDVYALAAVIYFLLTGKEYFKIHDPLAPFRGDLRPQTRTTLAESPTLHPQLKARTEVCAALDRVLAEATNAAIDQRPKSAEILAWRILGALRLDVRARSPGALSVRSPVRVRTPELTGFRWTVAGKPMAHLVVRSVAWNADGRALAATDRGLAFWDGTQWSEVGTRGYPNPQGIRVVRKQSKGNWLLGGDGATIARFDGTQIVELVEGPDKHRTTQHASGDLDDLAVFCFSHPQASPALYSICGRRWLEPLHLQGVEMITGLTQIADEAWLITGRAVDGQAFLGIHRPLRFRVDRLDPGQVRTLLAVTASPEREIGIACGLDGRIAWVSEGVMRGISTVREQPPLSCAALDPSGRVWVASAGAIWSGDQSGNTQLAWTDRSFPSPFAAMHAEDGALFAMTVDGGVVEARREL